ncbi:MAG TPA: acyl-CoA dehydrogenase family protein [Candidatus Limnocylindrales bacterium]|nr:acyl-CoA dehydrogenase family protein [Candidatus Limnocylindrales bacterium]
MGLVLTEDQQMLKSSAADFVKKESPVARVRQLRDSDDPAGYSPQLWAKMAELGWPAILIPEEYGGLGMGNVELACVLEEFGRNLVPEPLLSTVLLGANAVLLGGSDQQKKEILPSVADGTRTMTLAWQERGSRYDRTVSATRAVRSGTGYRISGEKTLVLDGATASTLVVVARTSGGERDAAGLSLFLVERGAAGLTVVPQKTMHLRPSSIVRLSDVEVPASAMIGNEGGGAAVVEDTLDRATVGLCAEMLGNMRATFEMTLEYLKTRKQFGVPIGSFQALKHRAAKVYVELELARSAVLGAATALDNAAADARALVSVAKARCSDAAVLTGYEGVQMHGGIGMTDEHDIGLYLKRMRGSEMTFGDAAWHRDRFASLQGF